MVCVARNGTVPYHDTMLSPTVTIVPTRVPPNRIRPLIALRALRNLARSHGKDLPQGVVFLRATEGHAARRAFDRFRTSAIGRDVLGRRRALSDYLLDRNMLAAMSPDSLGRAYLEFLLRANISVPSLLDLATSNPYPPMSDEEWLFTERSHVMHDLWHVVSGYGAEEAGELCLLAVRGAQMRHLGVWLLCLFGVFKVGREHGGRQVRRAVREALCRRPAGRLAVRCGLGGDAAPAAR
jgi:ubiquinone biosynthesis protein COQ4